MAKNTVVLVEAEQTDGLSARKLIVEGLRCQVIMAHSGREALAVLSQTPADIVLVHSSIENESCEDLISAIRQGFPSTRVAALAPGGMGLCGPVITIDSLRPQELVSYFKSTA